jgi:hypothetical protein
LVIVSSPTLVSTVVYPTGDSERSVSPGLSTSVSPSPSLSPSVSPAPDVTNSTETTISTNTVETSSSTAAATNSLVSVSQNIADFSSKVLFAHTQDVLAKKFEESDIEEIRKEFFNETTKKSEDLSALEIARLIDKLISSKSKNNSFIDSLKNELTVNSAKKLWASEIAELNTISGLLSGTFDRDFHRALFTIIVAKATAKK